MSRSAIKRTLATQNAAFEALGLSKSVASAIAFPEPTKIQELGIPAMLNEKIAETLDSGYELSVIKLFYAIVDGYSIRIQVFAVPKKLLN